jgi:hypothetical protein
MAVLPHGHMLIDESAAQFNKLHSIVKNIRGIFSGENGILTMHYRKKLKKEQINYEKKR